MYPFFQILLILSCFLAQGINSQDFKAEQNKFVRVREAYTEKETVLKRSFKEAQIPYPPKEIFIRIFKYDKILELWVRSEQADSFVLFKEYKICASSGKLGPKRRQGDYQVPEGFYTINEFNPFSNFHLSLGINYPNESDKTLGVKGNLGGNIFIHGDCVTIGCIPITNDCIKEVYLMAVEAKASGQKQIPVHIFPTRFDKGAWIFQTYIDDKGLTKFWNNLQIGYEYFESHKRLPTISIKKDGSYQYGT
jgi:murein L,D-transpeptidase YafK